MSVAVQVALRVAPEALERRTDVGHRTRLGRGNPENVFYGFRHLPKALLAFPQPVFGLHALGNVPEIPDAPQVKALRVVYGRRIALDRAAIAHLKRFVALLVLVLV